MPIANRLLKIAEDALALGVLLVSDALDSWSSGESRTDILDRLRDNAKRAGELALENERLKDEVDRLRFNGPTLYKDEVESLQVSINFLETYFHKAPIAPIKNLLDRCDHMPMTAKELADQVDDITSGRVAFYTWDEVFGAPDPGRDVDDDPMPCRCGWDFNYGDTCPHGTKGQGA